MKRPILLLTMLLGSALCLMSQALYPYQDPNLTPDERAADLLSRLTLEQKAVLMVNTSSAIPELGIRHYDWWSEALHGYARSGLATVFPQSIAMAASFDTELVERVFTATSDEGRAKHTIYEQSGGSHQYQGLTVWTPNINIFRDPRWGRGQETYGEDPYLTATMGLAVVRGLQGPEDSKYDKLHACAKHYAVHSGPEYSRHAFNAEDISLRDLTETYLYAFERLVREGHVKEVMCAYNAFEGEPCCGSNTLLVQILRNQWGYDDVVVSDCGAIDDFYSKSYDNHRTHPDAASATADAVINGTDLNCGGTSRHIPEAVERGLLTEEQVNTSVFRLLRARFQLGEMDPDSIVEWTKISPDVIACDEHDALALKMAHETVVLLQNKRRALPLDASQYSASRRLAVIGPNAADTVIHWGNYNGTPRRTYSVLDGIRTKLSDPEALYYNKVSGLVVDAELSDDELLAALNGITDVVYVGGISPKLEGEEMRVDYEGFRGGDRTSIELPAIQRHTLEVLHAAGKRVIYVNLSGSAIALEPETKSCDAIVQGWYGGQNGGIAIADVLFGDYNPAGRLPVTFYKNDAQLPDYEDYNMSAGHTYRYMKERPLFPFGYGLSYSKFRIGRAHKSGQLTANASAVEGEVELTIPVKNLSHYDGEEVVQLYVAKKGEKEGPCYALRGFKRVAVPALSKQTVTFTLTEKDLRVFSQEAGKLVTTPGTYRIYYGPSSDKRRLRHVDVKVK
jgi:Beta-glucosidase-related glycosidases